VFESLRELRDRLSDSRTFASAAADVGRRPDEGERPGPAGTAAAAAALAGGNLLDRMLDAAPAPAAGGVATKREDDLTSFVREVLRPHLVEREDPRQAEMVAGVDAALATQMRALLHAPSFQSLESAWRTVDFLARRIDTSTQLRLYLLDVPRAALDRELADVGGGVGLARLMAEGASVLPDGGRWSALVGLYEFGTGDDDAVRIAQLGAIARQLGAPFLTGAAPSVVGRDSWAALPDPRSWPAPAPTWDEVRAMSEATFVALAGPRFLLRSPYGRDGEPTEAFAFEEVDAVPAHGDLLWGNGAAVCALLLAEAFAEEGWAMRGPRAEVRGLPLHVYRADGEAMAVPCAETLLSERAADRLMELGITPLAWLRDTDVVRIVRLQSVASPPTRLAAAWGSAR
jgi:type VI secretion system protein ImpC